ncbi:unnamed protein product [Spirodela intermedia]|uniref:Uncharacterized protein n=1 Tax=Spirodela intermedia TaxID=51605 RepID=A0A7I8IJ37_SPIIN|nr:unnamed protein product [Spirodela intermedia]CAA6657885.1 unnamed protein product [Spirodela intermedia]
MNLAALRRPDSAAHYRYLSHRDARLRCSAGVDGVPRVQHGRAASSKAQACTASVRGNAQITTHGRAGNVRGAQAVFDSMPHRDVISWTALLTAYADCRDIRQAREVFDGMPKRNVASWNAMISAYAREMRVREASELFGKMPCRNAVSYAAMISGFARAGMMREAEELYAETPPIGGPGCLQRSPIRVFEGMAARDVVSWSSMVNGYCKRGMIEEARKTFGLMPQRNVVSWTAMIRGYMKAGLWEDGLLTFMAMRRESVSINPVTLSGRQTHGLILRLGFCRDNFLGNSLIAMYSSVKRVDDARKAFDNMEERDVVSWNSMIGGYVHSDLVQSAHELFEQMPTRDVVSWTSMLVGFSNSGRLAEAVCLFQEMPKKDHVAWTAMLAFRWFIQMLRQGITPNPLSLSSILSASVHASALKMDMESDLSVQNALVSMYAKCGNLHDACRVFSSIRHPNVHGLAEEALKLFRRMEKKGCQPNRVTSLALLSACSHAGRVDLGLGLFHSMRSSYGIEPGPDHYTCMVDLLGRAGLLEEAVELIGVGALLGASRAHRHLALAEHAAGQIFELEPENAAAYVVLSEMYCSAGLKKDEEDVRTVKRSRGVRKNPGCSWITLGNRVSVFLAGDKVPPRLGGHAGLSSHSLKRAGTDQL